MNTSRHNGTALITGASSGIGAVYAGRLARRGYDLILVARNVDRLCTQATKLTDETGRSIEILGADLTDRSDLARVARVLQTDASITLLLINAGIGAMPGGAMAPVAPPGMEAVAALNICVAVQLTYAVAAAFAARGTGTIITIAPGAAIAPERLTAVHAGSNAFLRAFGAALQQELAGHGIRLQAVLAATPRAGLPHGSIMAVERIVDAALAALDRAEIQAPAAGRRARRQEALPSRVPAACHQFIARHFDGAPPAARRAVIAEIMFPAHLPNRDKP